MEEKRCWVQLERVEVVLKDTEQIQMRPGHMEESRPEEIGTPGDFGLKKVKQGHTKSSGRVKVKCDECGKFISKKCLLNHKKIVHRGEALFKCWVGDCGLKFSSNWSLSDHKRVDHGYPKLRCKVVGCGSEFLIRKELDNHGQRHQGKTECDECGKSMSSSHLSTHKKLVHRGEKPIYLSQLTKLSLSYVFISSKKVKGYFCLKTFSSI